MNGIAGMAELADALDLGSSGRPCRFESCCPHSKKPLYLREERRIYKGFSLSLILYEMFSDRKFTDAAYQSYVAGAGFCLTNW